MKLATAYLCIDCLEIQDRAPRGTCDKCGSHAVWPLARALDDKKSPELKVLSAERPGPSLSPKSSLLGTKTAEAR